MALVKTEKLAVSLTLVNLAWAGYLALALLLPAGPNPYKLSPASLNLLRLTIAIPLLLVWQAAFYGALTFRGYATKIQQDRDGRALHLMARGLMILAVGLVVGSLTSSLRNYSIGTDLIDTATILHNYIQVVIPMVAMYLVFQGSKQLSEQAKKQTSRKDNILIYAMLGVLSAVYLYLVLNNPNREAVVTAGIRSATYYLPDWMVISTIVIPYIITWLLGALAVKHILSYHGSVGGAIYRPAFQRLAYGLIAVIVLSVMLQFVAGVSASLVQLGLTGILALVYLIIAVYALGYALIASGATKLNRIEEAL